jgi:hypothetical protein
MTAIGEMECLTIRRHDIEEEKKKKKKKKKKSYTFNASLTMGGRTRHACLCVRRSGFWGENGTHKQIGQSNPQFSSTSSSS